MPEINEEAVQRLIRIIIRRENENVRSNERTDAQMVRLIKDMIREEVHVTRVN